MHCESPWIKYLCINKILSHYNTTIIYNSFSIFVSVVVTNGNELLVHFVSDLSVTAAGFMAHYKSIPRGSRTPTSGLDTVPGPRTDTSTTKFTTPPTKPKPPVKPKPTPKAPSVPRKPMPLKPTPKPRSKPTPKPKVKPASPAKPKSKVTPKPAVKVTPKPKPTSKHQDKTKPKVKPVPGAKATAKPKINPNAKPGNKTTNAGKTS